MVALKGQQINNYIKSLPSQHTAALIFGTDPGAVSDRASLLSKAVANASTPPGEILRLNETDLEQNPDRLAIELRTVSMFGGRPVVRVTASRRINTPLLTALLTGGSLEGFLIVEAQSLKADDNLRALFERSPIAIAVACYADEARDLDALISEVLAANHLTINSDARRMLASRLGADRSLSRNELEKLAIYAMDQGEIKPSHIDDIIGDAAELAIDKVIAAAGAGYTSLTLQECDRMLASGESAQTIIILTQRHFQRLHRIRAVVDQGRSIDDALRTLRPPLHFKLKSEMIAQVQNWTMQKLNRALTRIIEAQRASRLTSVADDLVAVQLLLDLSRLAAWRTN